MRQGIRVVVAVILLLAVLRVYAITNSAFILVLLFIALLATVDAKMKADRIGFR